MKSCLGCGTSWHWTGVFSWRVMNGIRAHIPQRNPMAKKRNQTSAMAESGKSDLLSIAGRTWGRLVWRSGAHDLDRFAAAAGDSRVYSSQNGRWRW